MSGSHENEKKRKRRSFWEPESEQVITWLDAQTDLGTSLQLIIVDAIRTYGKGDVIKAHLAQRERFDQESAPQPLDKRPPRPMEQPKPLSGTTSDKPTSAEPVLPSFSGIEDDREDDEQDMELDSTTDPEPKHEQLDESSFDIEGLRSEAEDEDQDEDATEDEDPGYDPIAIMMSDIGSTYNK